MLGLAFALLPAALLAQQQPAAPALDQTEAIRASQAVVGQPIGDHVLLDREGRPVRLASYRGKPLLVSFIYTGCFQVCPTTTRSLDETVRALQGRFGDNLFNVVSIGFNQPADSPQALKAFAAQLRISRPNWDFLSPAGQRSSGRSRATSASATRRRPPVSTTCCKSRWSMRKGVSFARFTATSRPPTRSASR